ncbi:MAG TPA: GNAT family N-acetyltransferase [Eudoraea sp.]|nr:GNAT family N-acetyltransferase [Eudoraea sp.]
MQPRVCLAQSRKELEQILELQQHNLPQILSPGEKVKEGFVTVSHSLDLLERMNAVCQHIIAKKEGQVIGYALSMHPDFGNEIEVLKPMFDEVNSSALKDAKYIVMGQICIAKEYRGSGIFRQLYKAMQEAIQPHFQYIITEVDAKNLRSLNAHYAVGFKDLKRYHSGGQDWHLIVL